METTADLQYWQAVAAEFRKRPGCGPTLKVLEAKLWSVPGGYFVQFESTEAAERILTQAGFKFIPAEKGFRIAQDARPT